MAVVSPAGPATPAVLDRGLNTLESWGLEVLVDEAVFARSHQTGYLAGDDASRLDALHEALAHPGVAAIIFSRGGYGTMRLLADIDVELLRARPKVLVGFSDITALHLHVAANAGVATLHGPVVKSFGRYDNDPHQTLAKLRGALFGTRDPSPTLGGLESVVAGTARGPVLGGNLSIVASMLDSPFCPDLNGAIIVLEDTGEEDYRLDRLFTTLRLSARASDPAAIVLGDFTGCAGAYVDEEAIPDFVAGLAAEFDCPVARGLPCGHGHRNVPLPLGVEATLDVDRGTLSFDADAAALERL